MTATRCGGPIGVRLEHPVRDSVVESLLWAVNVTLTVAERRVGKNSWTSRLRVRVKTCESELSSIRSR